VLTTRAADGPPGAGGGPACCRRHHDRTASADCLAAHREGRQRSAMMCGSSYRRRCVTSGARQYDRHE
jgi:hypothetical protein